MSQVNRPKKGLEPPRQNPLPAIISAAVVVLLLAGLVVMLLTNRSGAAPTAAAPTGDAFSAEATSASAAAPVPAAAGSPAAPVGAKKSYAALPPMTIDPQKNYTATITTPRGDIVVKLRPDLAPQTVNSFVFLSKEGFYDGLTWHRVLPNFMAQGGDPLGTGTGGPGYSVPDEFTDKVLFDKPGILAMAHSSAPNSNGSQFFITTAPATYLNSQYTVFGEVQQGLDIVTGIPLRDPDQSPTTPGEQIVKITIAEQ